MSDTAITEAALPATTSSPAAKKSKVTSAASKKPRVKPSHPPTADMVNAAIKSLKERGGSSLQAIKKYITANYKIDAEKISPFIKKYLKSAVTGGKLIQTKGKGASGSFKLSATGKVKSEESAPKKAVARPKKTKTVTSEKKPKVKKVASPAKKKPADKSAEKKKKAAAPAKAAKKAGSVKAPKEKSTKPKAAAKKPKTPKPKKAAPSKKAAPKKAAAPKKK
uniref:Histone H1 n=1 Tax=Rhynchosciara americana TaxID=7186 RepID=Q963G2_RHYAM|nr:histone H1 [Rhynchosciara americana]